MSTHGKENMNGRYGEERNPQYNLEDVQRVSNSSGKGAPSTMDS
jgi:hypothetical protein